VADGELEPSQVVRGDNCAARDCGNFRIEETASGRGASAATNTSTSFFDLPEAAANNA
jgi:hypothetical protein